MPNPLTEADKLRALIEVHREAHLACGERLTETRGRLLPAEEMLRQWFAASAEREARYRAALELARLAIIEACENEDGLDGKRGDEALAAIRAALEACDA